MRGRHFGFLATLCSVWIAARVGFLAILPEDRALIAKIAKRTPDTRPVLAVNIASVALARAHSGARNAIAVFVSAPPSFRPTQMALDRGEPTASAAGFFGDFEQPLAHLPLTTALPLPTASAGKSPWSVYAYSFVRGGGQSGASLGGGQYGGSQSGFIGTYALDNKERIAMMLRGAIAHDNSSEREIAAGLRLRPARNIPVTLTVERRFRNARADAFVVYAAGGVSQASLPLDFRLDAFAQAGLVSGKDSGPFFDLTGRAERRVVTIVKTPVTVGAGIWSGGQKGIFRIDAGPTIGTEIRMGPTYVRVNADWRFRIAGDARPASGPALTLSTSF